MDPHFTYRFKDPDFLNWIKGQFDIAKEKGAMSRNMGNVHHLLPIGGPLTPFSSFWGPYPEKLDLLTQLTYPYGEKILIVVIKHYTKNEYSSLHQDDPEALRISEYRSLWTNSILIDKSDDVKGGDVVIAGDGFEPDADHLKSRLITLNHEEIGNSIVWDSEAVHGVSRIEKGYRTALIVVKAKEE